MAIGDSGRIVIEVDPKFKKDFHKILAIKGITLKDWFLEHAEDYIKNSDQLKIFES